MVLIERGIVSSGGIALDKPLSLPEGTRVVVRVEAALNEPSQDQSAETVQAVCSSLPFIGQWADRQDLADSAEYVRQERAKWHQRALPSE